MTTNMETFPELVIQSGIQDCFFVCLFLFCFILFCFLFLSAIVKIIGLILRLVPSWSQIADTGTYKESRHDNLQKMEKGVIFFSLYAFLLIKEIFLQYHQCILSFRSHWLWLKLILCDKGRGTRTVLAFLASHIRVELW